MARAALSLGIEDYDLVEKQMCIGDEGRPRESLKMEAASPRFALVMVDPRQFVCPLLRLPRILPFRLMPWS